MGNLNETLAASVLPGFAGKVAELLAGNEKVSSFSSGPLLPNSFARRYWTRASSRSS